MSENKLAYQLKISKVKGSELKADVIKSSEDAYNFAKKFFFEDIGIFESFFIIIMNRANRPIGWYKIAQGGVSGVTVDIKIICKVAVDSLTSGVILIHNHPSGSLVVSQEDKDLTKKVKQALSFLDIRLIDHLIMTENGYNAFSSNEELRKYICS